MNADWLLGWWNLVFIVPFLLALIYLGVYTVSGITFGEGDAVGGHDADADADHDVSMDADHDVDVDHDVAVEVDHDVDVDHDVAVDADADADADADGDTEAAGDDHGSDGAPGSGSSVLTAMTWLGVGRVPLSILLMVLLLSWGAIGFVTNQLARPTFGESARVALVSLPLAFLCSLLVTRGVVLSIGRWMPLNETTARRHHELMGYSGETVFATNDRFGMVCVRDERGERFTVPCRVERGREPLPKGSRVLLTGYNAKDQVFYVVPFDTGEATARSAGTAAPSRHDAPAT